MSRSLARRMTAYRVCGYLEQHLPDFAKRHIAAAFAGDVEAAGSPIVSAPNEYRGLVVLTMYLQQVPRDAYRAALRGAWDHDHAYVIAAARHRGRLIAMFRQAHFPIPDLPPFVPVWHGTSGFTAATAARGYSWTLNRDVACWFAMRSACYNGRPLVLRRTVSTRDLVYYSNERDEAEVVLARIGDAAVDSDLAEWHRVYARVNAERNAEKMARLSSLKVVS